MTPYQLVGFGSSVELDGRDVTVTPAEGPDVALVQPAEGSPVPVPMTLAVSIGRLHEVTSWQRLIGYDTHVHLETRSGLGAFYDITDTEALRPLVDDARYMTELRDRAVAKGLVGMAVDGKAVAVLFSCPGGPGSYPAYHGFEVGMGAVAVLVDLQVPGGARTGPRP